MPIGAAVGFVAEQGVGILVGAAAVALAPFVGRKLHGKADGVQQATTSAVDTARDAGASLIEKTNAAGAQVAGAVSATALAVTQPVADTGKSAYHATLTGAHWYVEQWVDIAAEAREWVSPSSHLTASEVVASLPLAKVVSDIPGRARLRAAQIRGDSQLAKEVAESVFSQLGGGRVTASPATGNVLIHYDQGQYGSLNELLAQFAG